ncbi:MAG TPA: ATP-binding protein, partial [Opitutaceae bacterium]|nr:ATP-binding protein [Opitutaceae bacterium]
MAVGAFVPLHLWLFLESVASPRDKFSETLKKSLPLATVNFLLAAIVFTDQFSPWGIAGREKANGPAFPIHIVGVILCYVFVIWNARRIGKKRDGIEKLELTVILVGGASAGIVVLLLMLSERFLGVRLPHNTQIAVEFTFFALLTVAITTHKIFDARHLITLGIRALGVIVTVSLASYQIYRFLQPSIDEHWAYLISTIGVVTFLGPTNRLLSRFLKLNTRVNSARNEAYEISRNCIKLEDLDGKFERVIHAWSGSERVLIEAVDANTSSASPGLFESSEDIMKLLRELRWVTPERLQRERTTVARTQLASFLTENRLAAVCICESIETIAVIAVGERPSRRPFTYPEIQDLLELGAIVEAAQTRCKLAVKAHRAERLATVGVLGAGVAHEIRNPLVTIKTFVQLLPLQYNSEIFREKFSRLMGQEVSRIESLTEQLLDLAAPKKYHPEPHSLHQILRDSLDVISLKAKDKSTEIQVNFDADPDRILTDLNATKQVVMNLCFNAMQAQERQEKPRWIKIETKRLRRSIELKISDNGPGIATEMRGRLFETFQTTKSSGFGLGLAVCSEILHSL